MTDRFKRLDEALAEYSLKLYYERLHGPRSASILERQRWQTPLDLLISSSEDEPLNRSVESFGNGQQYETIIYGKGALFYSRLREILGDRRFQRFLRDYLANHRYQIVDTETWRESLQSLQLPELEMLFDEWVGEESPPEPTPLPDAPADEDDSGESGDEQSEGDRGVEEKVPDTL